MRGGSQCGYCTPGFVCSMAADYYRPGRGEGLDVHAVSGNLCRCTGYRPIRDAAEALAAPPDGDVLARRQDRPAPPPAVTRLEAFARPADLAEALRLLREHPDATVVAGATDLGVEVNLRGRRPAYVVAIDRLPELREVSTSEGTTRSRSAPRSRSPRSRRRSAGPCPCWTPSGRSSPRR